MGKRVINISVGDCTVKYITISNNLKVSDLIDMVDNIRSETGDDVYFNIIDEIYEDCNRSKIKDLLNCLPKKYKFDNFFIYIHDHS